MKTMNLPGFSAMESFHSANSNYQGVVFTSANQIKQGIIYPAAKHMCGCGQGLCCCTVLGVTCCRGKGESFCY